MIKVMEGGQLTASTYSGEMKLDTASMFQNHLQPNSLLICHWRRAESNLLDQTYSFYHQNDVLLTCLNRLDFLFEFVMDLDCDMNLNLIPQSSHNNAAATTATTDDNAPDLDPAPIIGIKLEAMTYLSSSMLFVLLLLFFLIQDIQKSHGQMNLHFFYRIMTEINPATVKSTENQSLLNEESSCLPKKKTIY